jgi:hypothetical protein
MTTIRVEQSGSFWRKFTPLFGAGLVGIAAAAPLIAGQIRGLIDDKLASAPPLPVIVGAALAQTTAIMGVAIAAGIALAPRLGLRSHLVEKGASGTPVLPALRPEIPAAVAGGVAAFAVITGLDQVFKPFMLEALQALSAVVSHTDIASIAGGLFYGGIVEELLLRWGVMTVLVWTGWRLIQGGMGTPRPAIMWGASVIAALLFGALHLPFTATITSLTPVIVARALLLNGIVGVVFGWLYWRKSLEAAMLSHMTFHICATIVALVA